MVLYHFTAGEYLRGIAEYGLTVGDVPTDFNRLKSKVGVWFTTSEIVPLIPIKEAAKLLGKTVRTVRRWQAAGKMPPRTKHGHRMKYRRDDIKALVAANLVEVSE